MSFDLVLGALVLSLIALAVAAGGRTEPHDVGACFGDSGGRPRPTAVERTFVFADLVGFTAFAEAEGDSAAAAAAERFRWAARRAVRGDATLVKGLGDGVMIAAGHPASAVATAVALRDLVAAEPGLPPVAVGIHRGAAVEVGGDYFGTAVNLAARVVEEARPAQILCTESVTSVATPALVAVPVGVSSVRGVSQPVVLYELSERATTGGER